MKIIIIILNKYHNFFEGYKLNLIHSIIIISLKFNNSYALNFKNC
jgi:hypothetical protein